MAAAETYVRPGQTDVTLTVEIENEADSGADIASAQVDGLPSEGAPVTNIRISPAVAIPIGQTKTFTVTFDIAGTANDGPFSITLQDIVEDAVDPDPATLDTQVDIRIIDAIPPMVSKSAAARWVVASAGRFQTDLTLDLADAGGLSIAQLSKESPIGSPVTVEPLNIEEGLTTFNTLITGLEDGRYSLAVRDLANNETQLNFELKTYLTGASIPADETSFQDLQTDSGGIRLRQEAGRFLASGEGRTQVWDNRCAYECDGEVVPGGVRTEGIEVNGGVMKIDDIRPSDAVRTPVRAWLGQMEYFFRTSDLPDFSDAASFTPFARKDIYYEPVGPDQWPQTDTFSLQFPLAMKRYIQGKVALANTAEEVLTNDIGPEEYWIPSRGASPLMDPSAPFSMTLDVLKMSTSGVPMVAYNTPTGQNVTVLLQGELLSSRFGTVLTGGGNTTVTYQPSSAYQFPPGYLPPGYEGIIVAELATTAQFEGPVTITFRLPYDNQRWEILRQNGASFERITGSVNRSAGTISATTAGMGTFVRIAAETTPPATGVAYSGPSYMAAGGTVYMSSSTAVGLNPSDAAEAPFSPAGVAATSIWVDVAPESCVGVPPDSGAMQGTCGNTIYQSTFSLAAGSHTIWMKSSDSLDNAETPKSVVLNVDAVAPITDFVVLGSSETDAEGRIVFGSTLSVSLNPLDPLSGVVQSGVAATYIRIADEFGLYSGSFTLPVGTYTLSYYSIDNVGNQEEIKSVVVVARTVDLTPPVTELSFSGGRYIDGQGQLFVSTATAVALLPEDLGDPISGVEKSFFLIDPSQGILDGGLNAGTAGQFAVYSGTFTLPEGTHTIAFASLDFAGNYELLKTTAVRVDGTPPDVALTPQGSSATDEQGRLVVSSQTPITLITTDPESNGVSVGAGKPWFLIDVRPSSCAPNGDPSLFPPYDSTKRLGGCRNYIFFSTTTFTLAEGTHTVRSIAWDRVGNTKGWKGQPVDSDATPPSTTLSVQGSSSTGPGGEMLISPETYLVLNATDPVTNEVNSGLLATFFLVDQTFESCGWQGEPPHVSTAPAGSCLNPYYEGAFILPSGSHTIGYLSIDRVVNQEALHVASVTVSGQATINLSPSSGPIGVPFTITGAGFGAYAGSNTRVKFGATLAPLSLWNDTMIQGTVPGLLAGTYPVVVEQQVGSTLTAQDVGTFLVTVPSVAGMSPSAGPIGTVFNLSGVNFGPYAGSNTKVLVGGVAASLSLWNDTSINGLIPGALAAGEHGVVVERITSDGGLSRSATVYFTVTAPVLGTVSVSTGPIGIPFTITGSNFGAYAGSNTRVKFGSTLAPLSLWTDTTIHGTVPGIVAGAYDIVVERQEGTSTVQTNTAQFTVILPEAWSVSPSSGPVGTVFTIAGSGFGPYAGSQTRVKVGDSIAALSLWNDTTISGLIPGELAAGAAAVVVERATSDGGLAATITIYFQVVDPNAGMLTPSSGPIGVPFTITGAGFGAYSGSNTRVKFGSILAPLSLWNDTTIQGTVPGLSTGSYGVTLERQENGFVHVSTVGAFDVYAPAVASFSPSSGPIGMPFTITGSNFGLYAGSLTRVKVGGYVAPLSLWNDHAIAGTIPGSVPPGVQPVVVERVTSDGGLAQSELVSFAVVVPQVSSLTPVSGPIGIPFSITGSGFGPYAGSLTRVKIGGYSAPLSLWNDTSIQGTIPGQVSAGTQAVIVERATSDGGLASTEAGVFAVVVPFISTMTPGYGPVGTAFTLDGAGFGPYTGSLTQVKVGSVTASLSLWTDTQIKGTIPSGLADGVHAVTVVRSPTGGSVTSNEVMFTVGSGMAPAMVRNGGLMSAADPSFVLRDVYVFPNPAVGGGKPVIHVAVGIADRVVIKIFDVSGRLMKEASLDGTPPVLDDGSGPKYAYEYTWDGHIPSGVYFYTIEAEKSGQKIQKAGRLAVVR